MPSWLALVGAYIVGSIDFAVVVARSRGVDIHSVGSGNPGTSNVLRTMGRFPAVMVLLGDMLKGVIAASFGLLAAASTGPVDSTANLPLVWAAGSMAVLGHVFPLFHKFKGGKGVATGGGVVLFALGPVAFFLPVVWLVVARLFKIAAVASLVVVISSLPLAVVLGARGWSVVWLSAMLVLIVWRHGPNIRRMFEGSEQKVPT